MTNYLGKMLEDAAAAGFIMTVYGGDSEPDFVGCHPAKAEEAIDAVEEAELILQDEGLKKVGWALIVGGVSEDERIADCGDGDWIDTWTEANIP